VVGLFHYSDGMETIYSSCSMCVRGFREDMKGFGKFEYVFYHRLKSCSTRSYSSERVGLLHANSPSVRPASAA
jgi:hypothetical protein